ncbi:MAG: hypothetical protein M3Y28_01590, partial [Armatimonadota bacterium]|nr:hypothetical protein [Armatimonadota bacterium]
MPDLTPLVVPLTYPQAFILGLVEGITEFLPVSSNAHMLITSELMHRASAAWPSDPGAAFSAVVQLGPILAIIAYFRHDLARFIAGIFRSLRVGRMFPKGDIDARLGWYVILGTLPVIVLGLALHHLIETKFRSMTVVAASTVVFAFVLLAAERVGRRNETLEQLTPIQAVRIGLAQCVALIPGASRSGVTITMGLFEGLERDAAARFSFLLSVPAITLAGIYELFKVVKEGGLKHGAAAIAGPYLISTVLAGGVAYLVIRWLLGYLRTHTTMP